MKNRYVSPVLFAFLSVMLCACGLFGATDHQSTLCKALKSKIIFNGATSNTQKANVENAEKPLLQHTYDQYQCE